MSAELLPCPFCGGEAVRNMGQLGDGSPWPYVECLDCTACAEPEMWNRRASSSQEIARLTERCDAYLGQVKVGDEQILALRDRAKEMQREKVELRQRCDAYREALEAAKRVDRFLPVLANIGFEALVDGGEAAEMLRASMALHEALAALATLQDKTP